MPGGEVSLTANLCSAPLVPRASGIRAASEAYCRENHNSPAFVPEPCLGTTAGS